MADSKETRARLLRLLSRQEPRSQREVAWILGVSTQRVSQILADEGISFGRRSCSDAEVENCGREIESAGQVAAHSDGAIPREVI